jgi:hypothetical protein
MALLVREAGKRDVIKKEQKEKIISLYLSVLHSVCVSVSVCMALLVREAGKRGRYKKGAERKDHLSLSLMCLLSFSTLFVCPCVRHRSWGKKTGMERRSKK